MLCYTFVNYQASVQVVSGYDLFIVADKRKYCGFNLLYLINWYTKKRSVRHTVMMLFGFGCEVFSFHFLVILLNGL